MSVVHFSAVDCGCCRLYCSGRVGYLFDVSPFPFLSIFLVFCRSDPSVVVLQVVPSSFFVGILKLGRDDFNRILATS